jgi:hypothetical protein
MIILVSVRSSKLAVKILSSEKKAAFYRMALKLQYGSDTVTASEVKAVCIKHKTYNVKKSSTSIYFLQDL